MHFEVREDPHPHVTMEASAVIIAIGQAIDRSGLDGHFALRSDGTLVVDSESCATTSPGVFAAGDVVSGPSTVVESMAAGRRAARAIEEYLIQGKTPIDRPLADTRRGVTGKEIMPEGITPEPRQEIPLLAEGERVGSFREVEIGFSKEQAIKESARCLRCKTCNRCVEEIECVALSAVENDLKMSPRVSGHLCAGCGRCAKACPYGNIHLAELA